MIGANILSPEWHPVPPMHGRYNVLCRRGGAIEPPKGGGLEADPWGSTYCHPPPPPTLPPLQVGLGAGSYPHHPSACHGTCGVGRPRGKRVTYQTTPYDRAGGLGTVIHFCPSLWIRAAGTGGTGRGGKASLLLPIRSSREDRKPLAPAPPLRLQGDRKGGSVSHMGGGSESESHKEGTFNPLPDPD